MTLAISLTSTRLPGLVVLALLGIVCLSVVAVAFAALATARAARRQDTLVADLEARLAALEEACGDHARLRPEDVRMWP